MKPTFKPSPESAQGFSIFGGLDGSAPNGAGFTRKTGWAAFSFFQPLATPEAFPFDFVFAPTKAQLCETGVTPVFRLYGGKVNS